MSNDVTSAQIKTDTWSKLNQMKQPGDSMDDVINRLIDERNGEVKNSGRTPATS